MNKTMNLNRLLDGSRDLRCVSIEDRVAYLRASGVLHRQEPALLPGLLRDVAGLDLSLGRLFEGHVNALILIDAYGTEKQRGLAVEDAAQGCLFGVWGADAPDQPAKMGVGNRLTGAKRFASGLGLVGRALVSAECAKGQQMVLISADDPMRQDPGAWDMAGMQDSRSGQFDLSGLAAEPLGAADVYTREPLFLGGTWRIAAVTLGATMALLEGAARQLRNAGRLQAEPQLLRLAPLTGRIMAAWALISRAADLAQGPAGRADPERAVVLSTSARLLSETLAQDMIAAVERSLGLGMFATDHPVGAAARDLACYVRQAMPDALMLQAGRTILAGDTALAGWLDD